MTSIVRKAGLVACGVLAAVGAWACSATRNGDGSFTLEFAPDMTITAWGLEAALRDCIDLYESCLDGTFSRPCTDAERADIDKAIERLTNRKGRILNPPEQMSWS